MPAAADPADPKFSRFLAAIEAAERDASAAEEELEEARALTKERKEIFENRVSRLRRLIRDFAEPAPLLDAIEARAEVPAEPVDESWRDAIVKDLSPPLPAETIELLIGYGIDTVGDLANVIRHPDGIRGLETVDDAMAAEIELAYRAFRETWKPTAPAPADDAWRSASLGQLPIPTDAWAALSEAGLETMGDLDDRLNDCFVREGTLAEIDGIDEATATEVERAFKARKAELLAGAGAGDDQAAEDGSWREIPLEVLGFPVGIHAKLHEAGLLTLGAIADWTASGKQLTDIPGIGPGKAGRIEDALGRFWAGRTPGAQPIPPASSEGPEPFEAADAVSEAVADDGSAPRRPARRTGKAQDAPMLPST